jgi:hypothetical protein
LRSIVSRVKAWSKQNPDTIELPRSIGEHEFTIGNITEKRAIGTFQQWKIQRILACYNEFDSTKKADVDALLNEVGGYEFMQMSINNPVVRVNNKLRFKP